MDRGLGPTDRQRLIEWNDTGNERLDPLALGEAFAHQARRTTDRVALVFPLPDGTDEHFSYQELEQQVVILARRLRAAGVGPEVGVGVCLERSPSLVIALLAVLTAGGAYVALDPAYPGERLAFILEELGAGLRRSLLLSERRLAGRLPKTRGKVVPVIWLDQHSAAEASATPGAQLARPANLAYVLYTSGSTGKPNGVAVTQGSAMALIAWARRVFSADELAGMVASTSINFDLSIFELFVPLTSGGTVILVENALSLAALDLGRLRRARLLNTVPSAVTELLRQNALPASLVTVNLAGEPLRQDLVGALYQRARVQRVVDLYGPSEDTTYSTWAERTADGVETIGRPIVGTRGWVVDRRLRLMPSGVAGELCLAGAGLARGYLLRARLSAQRFVPELDARQAGSRMYRTGDLVRHLPDGRLQFLGRIDHQVKIRGFRIELGEIEARLRDHPAVAEAVVVARALGGTAEERHLVAFYVPRGSEPSATELRQHLARGLSAAMLPSLLIARERLPLTPNGKIDRSALERAAIDRRGGRPLVPPRGVAERLVAAIWSELLGSDELSVSDSFFALGASSLDVSRLRLRLRQRLGLELSPQRFHELVDLAALARQVESHVARRSGLDAASLSAEELDRQVAAALGTAVEVPRRAVDQKLIPLSWAQERLWFIEILYPHNTIYNITRGLDLAGPLDVVALTRAFGALIERHEALRMVFTSHQGKPFQIVRETSSLALPTVDLRGLSTLRQTAALPLLERAEARRIFDLERGPVLRFVLFRLAADRFRLLLSAHHLVFDGWSFGILFRELSVLYGAAKRGERPALPRLPVRFGDLASWEKRTQDEASWATDLAYWRSRLAAPSTALELPVDRPRLARIPLSGALERFSLTAELEARLGRLAESAGASLFTVLLGAWAIQLGRYAGQDALTIAVPSAGRQREESEGLIGFFINALLLRLDLSGDRTVGDFLAATSRQVLADLAHQDLPFSRLAEELTPQRADVSRALTQVTLAHQNAPLGPIELDALEVGELTAIDTGQVDQDLILFLEERTRAGEERRGLQGWLVYSTHLFDRTTVARWLRHFKALLAALEPSTRLSRLSFLEPAERCQLLVEWNDRRADFPRQATVPELLRSTAVARGDAVALVDDAGRTVTYRALARRANGLAQRLVDLGAGPESFVAVGFERSLEAVIAVIAVLEAGSAYLPLDPDYPRERLAFMITDTRCRVLLADPSSAERWRGMLSDEVQLVVLEGRPAERDAPPPVALAVDNLAYVMYTSGSTGRPKGVAVNHRNIIRLVRGNDYARLDAGETFLLFAPLAFDASTLELWGALLNGGRLAIFPSGPASAGELGAELARQRVSTLWLTAGLFHQMIELELPSLGVLRQLLAGGDVLSPERSREVLSRHPHLTLINGYGPTETTTFACCHAMTDVDQVGSPVAIGRPLRNARVKVLGRRLEAQPIGVIGELMIAGDGVARGYFGRPGLTAERFLPELGTPGAGTRMYRTGDLVRWRCEGVLEILGRIDFQVKIRGFRIEPGEIQSVLEQHPQLAQAAVLVERHRFDATRADATRDLRLVAFAVPGPGAAVSGDELRRFLAVRLPSHMIPARFLLLDAFPLGPTGKIDRDALADLARQEPVDVVSEADTVAPRNPLESSLASITAELLGLERLGVEDDFFARGGHSLLATQLLARVRAVFDVELPLRDFFTAPTVAALAADIARALSGKSAPLPALARVARSGTAVLSFAQERLWFLDQLLRDKAVYNISWPLELRGPLDIAALGAAFTALTERHEALRTTFAVAGEQPAQVIATPARCALPVVDLSLLDAVAGAAEAHRLRKDDAHRPFALTTGPLLRLTLLRLAAEMHHLLLTVHHIVADGWSMAILGRELIVLYDAARHRRPSPLAPLAVQYADYAAWQRGWLKDDVLAEQIGFWRQRLTAAPSLLELPTDRPRPAMQTYRGGVLERVLPRSLSEPLRDLAREDHATLFTVFLAVFKVLLWRVSGQVDLAVGAPVAGRQRLELEGLIGFFVNTLVLRSQLRPGETVRAVLSRLRRDVFQALAHQDVPFERLVEELRPERSLSHTPFFQVMLAYQDHPMTPPDGEELAVEDLPVEMAAARFDLTLYSEQRAAGVHLELVYNRDLFDRATAARLLGGFERLLAAAVANPERSIASLELIDVAERHQLLCEWNDSQQALASGTLHGLIAEQAARLPAAIALSCEDCALTYGELLVAARRLAATLRARGVGREALVGVAAERGLEMVVGLVGILAVGAAYVPIDPSYPPERQKELLDDALGNGGILLTQRRLLASQSGWGNGRILLLEEVIRPGTLSKRFPAVATVSPDNLAYTIYTSGSTGKPKGVMNRHGAVLNRLLWLQARELLVPGDAVLQKTPFSFDVSVWEIFWPLISGARLVLARPEGNKDSAYLVRLIVESRIGTAHFVPSMLQVFVEEPGLEGCTSLERVIASGEALPKELQDRFFARLSVGVELFNLYGPTEAAIEVSFWRCRPGESVPIGRPVANTWLLVLDRRAQLLPLGIPGQLHLGGVQLARGYLRRPSLTAEKFIPDARRSAVGARLYATGDLARARVDGGVEYLGRVDHQVKIRGFRIELGEIEVRLSALQRVREAVVVVGAAAPWEGGLLAFVVARTGFALDVDELRSFLATQVPDHMVPSAFVVLDELPLTPNGKVDRRALSRRSVAREDVDAAAFVAPRTPVEELLASIWCELLGTERVGVKDSFFALGGHSLLATRLVARLRAELDIELPLERIFAQPTLEALAEHLAQQGAVELPALVPVGRERPLVASFAQERLWFLDQLLQHKEVYNIPWPLELRGHLDVAALAGALDALMVRHETLRTTFAVEGEETVQVIAPAVRRSLPRVHLGGLAAVDASVVAEKLRHQDAHRPFALARGPLWRAALLHLEPDRHHLLFSIHHSIADGSSMEVFGRELMTLYEAARKHGVSPLAPLKVQYADHAVWQRRWLTGDVLAAQLSFWHERLAGAPTLLELPTDRPRPPMQSYRGAVVERWMPRRLLDALRTLAKDEQATLFMVLLTVWQAVLARYAGQDDVSVGVPVAGRQQLELEGLIGFFVNTIVLRSRWHAEEPLRALLARQRPQVLRALAHQDVPFERLVEELQPERSLAHTPLFQVMLTYQDGAFAPLAAEGLEAALLPVVLQAAKFDLTLSCEPREDGLFCEMAYSRDLFDRTTVMRWLGHLEEALKCAVADVARPLGNLELIGEAERHQLLGEWNDSLIDAVSTTLDRLVAVPAATAPAAIAVVFQDAQLSYGALRRAVRHLAARLLEHDVGPDILVGIIAERSLAMVVGLLAILEAGAAYVPIDPTWPEERQRDLLEDALGQGGVLLTQQHLVVSLPAWRGRVLILEETDGTSALPTNSYGGAAVSPENLVYTIYTSGSTGKPKGAMNRHAAIVNRLLWMQSEYDLTSDDVVLQKTPFSFDVSVWEFFWPLLVGARLVIAKPEGHKDSAYLRDLIVTARVSTLHFVPSMLQVFVEEPDIGCCSSIRRVIASGEALPRELQDRFFVRLPAGVELHNLYGPTEAAIDVSFWRCYAGESVPIGRPVANTRLVVFARRARLLPIGVPGQLHLGGIQLARGYLRRPALSAEKLVPDPLSAVPGARLYATGDLARARVDGSIEYLGRVDHQVKIRGFRIELGEIEARLGGHPRVREAVVVVGAVAPWEGDLLAFVVARTGFTLDADELRSFLATQVPEHMVPSAFVIQGELPLTPNGKVDRRALSRRQVARQGADAAFVAPRTPVEKCLAAIWCELLGAERVGIHDSFFALGGHSLMAARLVARVRSQLDVELPLREVFALPTLSDLAVWIVDHRSASEGAALPALTPRPRRFTSGGDCEVAMSFAQERLWFLDQLLSHPEAYNIPWPLRLRGELDVAALTAALAAVVARHEPLRTRMSGRDEEPRQVIAETLPVALPVVDLSALGLEAMTVAEALRQVEAHRPFVLNRAPLWRVVLLRFERAEHHLLLTLHHIVADGWSLVRLGNELVAFYDAARRGRSPRLPDLAVQYADFAAWQREALTPHLVAAQLDFWRRELERAPAVLELPGDRPRPKVRSYRGAMVEGLLPSAADDALAGLAQRLQATPFMVLLATFAAFLSRLSGQNDLAIGAPVAGRQRLELEPLIGFFVNTLVLRARVPPGDGFADLVTRLRHGVVAALAHQDVPFERLAAELQPERSLSHAPLFQVMLTVQEEPAAPPRSPSLAIEPLPFATLVSKFDLHLGCEPRSEGLYVELVFSRDLFDASTARRWLGLFARLLDGVVAEPFRPLESFALMAVEERQQLLVEWNDSRRGWTASEVLLNELVAAQGARSPQAVALSFADRQLSYGELIERARSLAAVLAGLGVGADVLVGIVAERSLTMVIGLLGILEAGAAYVPIDPTWPKERLRELFDDALGEGGVLLTEGCLLARLPRFAGVPVVIEEAIVGGLEARECWRPAGAPNTGAAARPQNLAYTIYTSGSTGKPKGAMNSHAAIVNRLLWVQSEYGLSGDDVVLQKTPFSFDVSVWELFWPLIIGARLVIAKPEGHKDSAYLARLIGEARISTLHFVPSMLQVFIEEPKLERCRSLQRVMASGEALPQELQDRFFDRMPVGTALHNLYGPTEAAVEVTFWLCRAGQEVPIGRPVANTVLRIFDRHLRPLPLGVPGQLFLGGVQLARGYLRRGALTAEKFLPDALATSPGERLYATGDLARWRKDGSVEYLGRLDHQVKIRGFRIELGEIEARLLRHPRLREAVVLARRDRGAARLVAYLVTTAPVTVAELRTFLSRSLPDYMVPAFFVVLDAVPLNANGKVDRRTLEEMPLTGPAAAEGDGEKGAARTLFEELLASTFSELLGVETVGREDSFFALGGHSLLATQLVTRVRSRLGAELSLQQIFEQPTVAALAALVETARASGQELPPLVAPPRSAELALSFAQERLWFLDQLEPLNPAYNITAAYHLRGFLTVAVLAAALNEILRRHEVLRSTFTAVRGKPRQDRRPMVPLPLPVIDLQALRPEDREPQLWPVIRALWLLPFDLGCDLLLRVFMIALAEDEHVLPVIMHHIASDGWSMAVFLRELGALYGAGVAGETAILPRMGIQYVDFAAWQRGWLRGTRVEEQLAFWRKQLDGVQDMLDLPSDRPRRAARGHRVGHLDQSLPPALTRSLRQAARQAGATPFMVLLATLGVLLSRLSGQRDLCVGTPIAGRMRSELENLIGFFLNTLVLRLDLDGRPSFTGLLARVREVALAAYDHQDIPFEKLLEELRPERDLTRTPYFQVFLNYLDLPRKNNIGGLELSELVFEAQHVKFDWSLYVASDDEVIELAWVYDAELYSAQRMTEVTRQFALLLEQLLDEPEAPVDELSLISEPARVLLPDPRRVLPTSWSGGAHQVFVALARLRPERQAVVDAREIWTYGELEIQSRRLAVALRAAGVERGQAVAIYAHRSAALVWGVLGVLRAGAAFVMLDPAYPAARLVEVLELAAPRAFLRVALAGDPPVELSAALERLGVDEISVLDGREELAPPAVEASFENDFVELAVEPTERAYLAFTSGSTGRPKGIVGHHGAIARYVPRMVEAFGLAAEDRFSMLSALAHDPLQRDILTPLQLGAVLHIPEEERLGEPAYLADWMRRSAISIAQLTPAMAQILADSAWRSHAETRTATHPATTLPALRYTFLIGDVLTRPDAERLRDLAPNLSCVNSYGSTETSRAVSYHRVDEESADGHEVLPLGRGLADVQLLVVGRDRRLAGIGELGELLMRSPHLALGYLDDPAATAAKLVPNPCPGAPSGDRVYRSGDLGRYLPDGQAVFVGRLDFQVKIRGFRIELGEIEAVLDRHPRVREAVVVARAQKDARRGRALVAYLVLTPPLPEPSPRELRLWVAGHLPDYMVPSVFVFLDALPLTPNRKIDRAALGDRPLPQTQVVESLSAPRNAVEAVLASIWRELIGLEDVAIEDNFFDLGGHSLHASRHMYRLQELLDLELPVRALFTAQTIAELALVVEEALLEAVEKLDDEASWRFVEALEDPSLGAPEPLEPPADPALALRRGHLSQAQLRFFSLRLRRAQEGTGYGQAIPAHGEDRGPLGWFQEMFWIIEEQARGRSVYLLTSSMVVQGALDVSVLRRAFADVIARQDQLRIGFGIDDEGCTYQALTKVVRFELPLIDLSGLSEPDRRAARKIAVDAAHALSFALARPPLMRVLLVCDGSDRHHLVVILHHIIADMWSLDLLLGDLAELYSARMEVRPPDLPSLSIQFLDYAVWERQRYQGERFDALLSYWGEKLRGSLPQLQLRTDHPRPAVPTYAGKMGVRLLSPELTEALHRFSRAEDLSLFMVLLAAFQLLLKRHSADDAAIIPVATPVANRSRSQVEQLVGCFASMVMLVTEFEGDPTLRELLVRVRETAFNAFAHEEIPFFLLVANFPPEDFNFERSPFQASFTLHNAPQTALGFSGVEVFPGELIDRGTSGIDLTLAAQEADGVVRLTLRYDTDLFTSATIEHMLDELQNILDCFVEQPEKRLSEVFLDAAGVIDS